MPTYEWDIETVDLSTGSLASDEAEIIDHNHADKLIEFLHRGHGKLLPEERLVLVRDDERHGRSWAYVKVGKFTGPFLDLKFKDAYDNPVVSVPIAFQTEFKKHIKDFF